MCTQQAFGIRECADDAGVMYARALVCCKHSIDIKENNMAGNGNSGSA